VVVGRAGEGGGARAALTLKMAGRTHRDRPFGREHKAARGPAHSGGGRDVEAPPSYHPHRAGNGDTGD